MCVLLGWLCCRFVVCLCVVDCVFACVCVCLFVLYGGLVVLRRCCVVGALWLVLLCCWLCVCVVGCSCD